MKLADTWWQFLIGIIYIAILVILVAPNSKAAAAVNTLSGALSSLIATATGNTSGKGTQIV